MKILWNKSYWIENYLSGKIIRKPSDFIQRMAGLADDISWQAKVYYMVKIYHRKKEKERLERISQIIFSDPGKADFHHKIYRIFK